MVESSQKWLQWQLAPYGPVLLRHTAVPILVESEPKFLQLLLRPRQAMAGLQHRNRGGTGACWHESTQVRLGLNKDCSICEKKALKSAQYTTAFE